MERAAKHASIKAGFNAGVLRREFLDTVWWVNEDGLNLGTTYGTKCFVTEILKRIVLSLVPAIN